MLPTVAVLWLSAASTAVPVCVWSAPSPNVKPGEQAVRPEPPSLHAYVTVGAPLAMFHHPDAGRGGATDAMIDGRTVSTSTSATVAVLALPALSTAVPVFAWFSPLPKVKSGPHESTRDRS